MSCLFFCKSGNKSADDLPEILANETFCFDCGPQTPCFNRCCADIVLPLTPYDVLRLRRQLDLDSASFLATFTRMEYLPETGLPLPLLRMIESPDAPCPFVTPAGCSVYEDRPGACRAYPLGRSSRITKNGIEENFVLIRDENCLGFDSGTVRTPAEWFANQGLERYSLFNDRYMRLMSLISASGRPIEAKLKSMCLLSLYQLDQLRNFINKMNIFSRIEADSVLVEKISGEGPESEEALLEFGLDWIELIIFGTSQHLRQKNGK